MTVETLWIVGQYRSGEDLNAVWDFQGVFSSREKAIAACRDRNYFIAPATLDAALRHEPFEWEGCEYPLCESTGVEE
jgi:hypothetical protein